MSPSITKPAVKIKATQTYLDLQKAYEFFNAKLFNNSLPYCLITLQRHKGSKGYYHFSRFQNTLNKADKPDEIALNPQTFGTRTTRDVVGTLVHAMAHCWQFHCGKPPRKAYHDREWAAKMISIGLQPSDSGLPGGKQTGVKMTHYLIKDGAFVKAYNEFAKSNVTRLYQDVATQEDKAASSKKAASKTKYQCRSCECACWGKPELRLQCMDCDEEMLPVE